MEDEVNATWNESVQLSYLCGADLVGSSVHGGAVPLENGLGNPSRLQATQPDPFGSLPFSPPGESQRMTIASAELVVPHVLGLEQTADPGPGRCRDVPKGCVR